MRIVTNPGSNLDEETSLALDVEVLPQKILVDDIPRDTRSTIDFAQVDGWIRRARTHPQVKGTTEDEFYEAFARLGARDGELLVISTSRKLIGSHDAAVAAAQRLRTSSDPVLRAVRVEVVDTLVTDVGAGLCTMAAVQARKAGLPLDKAAAFVRAFAARTQNVVSVATLDNLVKGGRANFLQAWVANSFNLRPILSIVDGFVASIGRISTSADLSARLEGHLVERVDAARPHWLGVAHGNEPALARDFAERLQRRVACEFVLVRPLSSSIYLHVGPGSLAVFLYPLDGLSLRLVGPPMKKK